MGWSSAGRIFDPMARALVQGSYTDEQVRELLRLLAGLLMDGDWDTEDESIQEFADHPGVCLAIRQARGNIHLDGEDDHAVLDYEVDRDRWVLRDRSGAVVEEGPGTAEEHDRLVRLFYAGAPLDDYRYMLVDQS